MTQHLTRKSKLLEKVSFQSYPMCFKENISSSYTEVKLHRSAMFHYYKEYSFLINSQPFQCFRNSANNNETKQHQCHCVEKVQKQRCPKWLLLDPADIHTATECLRYWLDQPQKCDSVKHCIHKAKAHFLCSPYLKIILNDSFFKLFLVYIAGFSLIYSYTNRNFILLPWKM